jgi:phosphohistidine phosphatase
MRRLTLMRHAEARWQDGAGDDLARTLSRRGISAAEAMGRRLLELELVPDRVIMGPAQRTRQTANLLARELGLPPRHVLPEEGLYLASAADILGIVRATGPRIAHLLVVAHNPGLSDLIHQLMPRGGISTLTTGALCSIEFDADAWTAIAPECVKDVRREVPPSRMFGLLFR